jgi:hypothetical protein
VKQVTSSALKEARVAEEKASAAIRNTTMHSGTQLTREIQALRDEIRALKKENAALKDQIRVLQEQVAASNLPPLQEAGPVRRGRGAPSLPEIVRSLYNALPDHFTVDDLIRECEAAGINIFAGYTYLKSLIKAGMVHERDEVFHKTETASSGK